LHNNGTNRRTRLLTTTGYLVTKLGFSLVLLYLVVSILSPDQIYPELAQYRIVLWIAIAAGLASICTLHHSLWLTKLPQTYVLLGLLGAIVLSQLAHLWFMGALEAFQSFMPSLVVFFLICLHVNTWKRLQILTVVVSGIALLLLSRGLWDVHAGNLTSPYLMVQNAETSPLIRIRAVGYLSDPNDFAQFLLTVIPLVALAKTSGNMLRNFFLVMVPCTLLIYGVYLTHSRGALLALTVVAVIAISRRVPMWVSIASGTLLFVGMKVSGFTGGRDVSVDAGADRIDLWGAGLHMFRSSPLWGVGYGKFVDFYWATAHNSFVLCLAEVGLIGCFCWLACLVISFLQLNSLAPFFSSFAKHENKAPEATETSELRAHKHFNYKTRFQRPLQSRVSNVNGIRENNMEKDTQTVRRWANALRLSLIGFVVTSWFLSRTYILTLYLLLGITAVLWRLANVGPQEMQVSGKWVRLTIAAEAGTIVALYVMIRLSWLFIR
jgi:hypothetical protein